jgi:glucans biosynthesis protein C
LLQKTQINRVNYIDWLRVGAMFLLLFFHTGRLFDKDTWHIKNAVLNQGVTFFNGFFNIWHMPLFFILAGASVWFALDRRSGRQFAMERVLRLFVPLVFGVLIIVPPQVYYERVFDGDFSGSFLAWYPNTFQGTYNLDNPASGNLSWHHLWFLAYLFFFSLILLPLFLYFKNQRHRHVISRIAIFLQKPGAIFLPAVPLIIINLVLIPIFGFGKHDLVTDWATNVFYITIIIYGFLLVSDSRIIKSVQQAMIPALIAAILFGLGIYIIDNNIVATSDRLKDMTLLVFYGLDCWLWLMVVLGAGSVWLNFNNKLLKYCSDAVLPVYILHQTLIVVIGYYVIAWDTAVAVKYFFVVFCTLGGSLAIFELIKRFNITRFLFGMKWIGAKDKSKGKI